jgi:hypothetical protein
VIYFHDPFLVGRPPSSGKTMPIGEEVEKVKGSLITGKANLKVFFSTLDLKALEQIREHLVELAVRRCTNNNLVDGADHCSLCQSNPAHFSN